MIETCAAIFALREIAATAARSRLACFVVGTNDLVKELRAAHMPSRANLAGMLAQIVAAARMSGIAVLDGVYNAIADSEGFAAECRQGRDFGFDGKTLIHPSQIRPCHESYSPSEAQVAEARQVSEAFALPENKGAGVIKVDSRMVERLHLAIAEDLLTKASLIGERTHGSSDQAK
jgi:citrate lyase subunit beta/citryl-CoA lyase